MPKKKILKKHGFSLNDIPVIKIKQRKSIGEFNPDVYLRDSKFIAQALWECLVKNDIDTLKEILSSHLDVVNKENFAAKSKISRRTLYRMLSPKGNPTLENLGKIIHELCA